MEAAVLIVEDEVLIAFHLQALVEQAGHRVTDLVSNPADAVASAAQRRPDFALMDMRLARGSNGLEAARMLYERFGIRSLFVSGNIDSSLRAQTQELRPLGYLGKPFMAGDVLAALELAVRQIEIDRDAQRRRSS
jgi:DNA-binding NarL/FixJ family response regulator